MSKKQILIIEDEEDILSMVRLRLESHGFDVVTAISGELGLRQMALRKPDLILLDLMLPGISGLDVLKRIRTDHKLVKTPVLIVSALGEENDVVVGLELGADDYLSKPFKMAILVARVNALLRRSQQKEEVAEHFLILGPIRIDVECYLVFVDEKQITLTNTEYRLLLTLVTSKGRVLTRNQLIDEVIGNDAIVTDRTIDVHLTSLRNKLGSARNMIETVRGVGYRIKR